MTSSPTNKGTDNLADEPIYIDLYEKRDKIYNRHITGFFQTARVVTLWIALGVYFLGPWLVWGDRQAVLFDLPARKFHIFFLTFWPQDFILLSWLLMIAALALFLFTALAGRLWCGFTCPQTAWTMVFMWIEYKTEGDRNQRIKLDKQPLSVNKALRKTTKHAGWLFVAFATAFTFVGYFSSIRELMPLFGSGDLSGWGYFWIGFFTVATYLNAGWLREQVCLYMCPYARFQSVMFDSDTMIISYDEKRGEPRGKLKKKKSEDDEVGAVGDCVDCNWCVQVCPTGIDIRDGLQYECIGCAACIDACDTVMEKVKKPKKLIRYSTENEMAGLGRKIIRPRILVYTGVLTVLSGLFLTVLLSREPLLIDVIQDRKRMTVQVMDGYIDNIYTLKLSNRYEHPVVVEISASGIDGLQWLGGHAIELSAGSVTTHGVRLRAPEKNLKELSTPVEFHVTYDDEQYNRSSRFFQILK